MSAESPRVFDSSDHFADLRNQPSPKAFHKVVFDRDMTQKTSLLRQIVGESFTNEYRGFMLFSRRLVQLSRLD